MALIIIIIIMARISGCLTDADVNGGGKALSV